MNHQPVTYHDHPKHYAACVCGWEYDAPFETLAAAQGIAEEHAETENNTTYWAISSIGWAKDYTPADALHNYYRVQARNFKHLHRTVAGRIDILRETAPPTLYRSPREVVGFTFDGIVRWEMADGTLVPAQAMEEVR